MQPCFNSLLDPEGRSQGPRRAFSAEPHKGSAIGPPPWKQRRAGLAEEGSVDAGPSGEDVLSA